jgi:hypothetical protein
MSKSDRNPARRNGKAWKKDPGVRPGTFTGRTVGGYSPAALQRRAAKRASA